MSNELTVAGLDALLPRVIKLFVAGIAAVVEPSTAASATAGLTGLLDGAALRAYRNDYLCLTCRRRLGIYKRGRRASNWYEQHKNVIYIQ